MSSEKRIPVSEKRWKQLGEMKDAGQTYDDLLAELIEGHREKQLAEMVRKKRESGTFVEIEEDDW